MDTNASFSSNIIPDISSDSRTISVSYNQRYNLDSIDSISTAQDSICNDLSRGEPTLVGNQDPLKLSIPSFETLSDKIDMDFFAYERLTNSWRNLKPFKYIGKIPRIQFKPLQELYEYTKEFDSKNRQYYVGQLKERSNSTPCGFGLAITNTGNLYQGYFTGRKLNGFFRVIDTQGNVYGRIFRNNKIVKSCQIYSPLSQQNKDNIHHTSKI